MAFFKKSKNAKEKVMSKAELIEMIEGGEIKTPNHIAFIMDGNGRWAKKRGLSRSEGHKNAENAIKTAVMGAKDFKISTVTLYTFSTENWSRAEEEKKTIFSLLQDFLARFTSVCKDNEIRVRILGDVAPFGEYGLLDSINKIQTETECFEKYNLNIALNYGGRQEILRACNMAVAGGKEVSAEEFEKLLYTQGQPDPDFIVRTSGETRLSNFLLYQSAYSELYFPDCLWPDFNEEEYIKAICEYSNRKRRFGKA